MDRETVRTICYLSRLKLDDEKSKKILSDLDAIIGMIKHHGKNRIAHGNTVLSEDDIALVFAKPKAIGKLKKLFSA